MIGAAARSMEQRTLQPLALLSSGRICGDEEKHFAGEKLGGGFGTGCEGEPAHPAAIHHLADLERLRPPLHGGVSNDLRVLCKLLIRRGEGVEWKALRRLPIARVKDELVTFERDEFRFEGSFAIGAMPLTRSHERGRHEKRHRRQPSHPAYHEFERKDHVGKRQLPNPSSCCAE